MNMNQKGFTLIELVMVLVLMGVIAVIVAPKLGDVTGTKASAFKDKLKADIRYAQNIAMTRNRRTRVNLTNTIYSVTLDNSAANNCSSFAAVEDPAGAVTLSVALDTGSYTGITITPSIGCLEYDSLGSPYNCVGVAGPPCSTVPLAATMTVDVNNDPTMRVSVAMRTGAVN